MGPLFKDKKFSNNRRVIADCEWFKIGAAYFFSHPKNQTLENHFYHFGLMLDSIHYAQDEKWRKEIFKPTQILFKGVFSSEIIAAVNMGLRSTDDEFDEKEYDKFDTYYWQITKAVEYKRDDWAFFMIFGRIQGVLNGNRITDERFIAYLNLFPASFLQKHKEQLQYNFNFFDERGYCLKIGNQIELKKMGQGLYQEIEQSDSSGSE